MDGRQKRICLSETVGPYGLMFMENLVPLAQSPDAKI